MHVKEVFNPGGRPGVTYNPRKQLELEKKFKDYLSGSNKFLEVTGPTKSGKTVLCHRMVKDIKHIWIEGQDIQEENDFWNKIIYSLGLYTNLSREKSSEEHQILSSDVRGKVSAIFSGLSGGVQGEQGVKKADGSTQSRTDEPKFVALEAISEQKQPIIIDDFHYVPPYLQLTILRSLKKIIYNGIGVVLVSVPHKAYDTVRLQADFEGRVQSLKIPKWEVNELNEIANQGFKSLNIISDEFVNEKLAEECFGNPQLMHEFCAYICRINHIEEQLPYRKKFKKTPNNSFFEDIACEITTPVHFDLLRNIESQKINVKDREGNSISLPQAILQSLANTGPKENISYTDFEIVLKRVIAGEIPSYSDVSQVLSEMQQKCRSSPGNPYLFEWDSNAKKFYLMDPYFSLFMRWQIREKVL